ncbi:MAG: hypothetical protein Q8Q36_00400 [bacterium]|nr:hypothetical protein [bacterium]
MTPAIFEKFLPKGRNWAWLYNPKENVMKVKELASCGIGMCPTVFEVTSESQQCVIGACPSAFKDEKGDLIIVGTLLTEEEKAAIAHKIKAGEENAIRVPRALIAGLKL